MAASVEEVLQFVTSLPEVSEGLHGHRPAYRTRNRLLLVVEPGESEVLVWADGHSQRVLAADAPEAFVEICGKDGRVVDNWLTVRLAHVDRDALLEVVEDAWRHHATKRAVKAFDERRL